jgi:hypothetical protein
MAALSAQTAELLFPEARHFVRRVDDPVSGRAITFHEYCAGNQVVTIRDNAVVIADYGKQEIIEIDRAAGTYSVTSFDAIARAESQYAHKASSPDDVKITVRVDESISLSRGALEVLIGAAYPNRHRLEHDTILNASRKRERGIATQSELHALPVEQILEHEGVTIRNAIVAIDGDRVPPDALLIPPGAKLVESRTTRLARELQELDRLPQ